MKSVPTANDALSYIQAGQVQEAEKSLKATLRSNPKDAAALYYLGSLHISGGQFEKGASHLRKAIRLGLENADIFNNLGAACVELGRSDEAEAAFKKALELRPDMATARFNMARLLTRSDLKAAIEQYEEVIDQHPDYFEALINLSELYVREGTHIESARLYLDRALGLAPERFEVHRALAQVLYNTGMVSTAAVSAEEAIRIAPQDPRSRWVHALVSLQLGRLEQGWQNYDVRFDTLRGSLFFLDVKVRRWEGQAIDNATILVWSDQGIGDDILYGTFLPDLLARAKKVIFVCTQRMKPIFERAYPNLEVRARELEHTSKRRIKADYQIPLPELGRHFRASFEAFPSNPSLLQADSGIADRLRARYQALAPGNKLVGISWKSKRDLSVNGKISKLEDWVPLLRTPGCTFVCLQYGIEQAEIDAFNEQHGTSLVFDQTVDPLKDMDASFAQCAAMDLVVSTSNTTVHTAASIGKPTWMVLPEGRGQLWYWFMVRRSSPFYPALRIFRQGPDGLDVFPPWTAVLESVGQSLRSWLNGEHHDI